MSNAVIVEKKGATKYSLREVKKFITSLNGEVKSKLSPSYSNQSLGACEGWHSTLFSHLRLLRLQLSEQYGIPVSEITTDHPVFSWMVKHVGFNYNRFQIGQDGKLPYSRNWGQKYKSAIIAIS
eukprot:1480092-Amphidinium_carterae.2